MTRTMRAVRDRCRRRWGGGGRQIGGDPHEAAGYLGSAMRGIGTRGSRGIPVAGREGLAGGDDTGQDVVLGVGAVRRRRVDHPAHRVPGASPAYAARP